MFGGSTSTEYEDIVNKATDENLTSENWEIILNLCDKVQDEKDTGPHAAIAAILKRLAHRNPNVQLYALSLTESLGKNLGIEIHREMASRAFTQGLEKLIIDRNTHEKVRRRALGLIAMWTAEFEKDETLGLMEECYSSLKAKNYKFELPQENPPPTVDDEIRRKEEEELQRVLEMSMQDKGGRSQWTDYSLAAGSSSSGGSAAARSSAAANQATSSTSSSHPFSGPKYSGGYVPARTPSPNTVASQQRQQQQQYQEELKKQNTTISATPSNPVATPAAAATPTVSNASSSTTAAPTNMNIVTRVRALHTFEPTEPGELAFEKGDIIKVVDRGYKDWWRGQLKGRTGIFPVNYVEPMPEPTAAELAKEAEQEAAVFAQAVNVEKLLNMLRALDPSRDNLADNEEIQELYRSSMALRPKIVKLIDKYSQKRADLVSMNETFVRARTIFDRMMEESLARHSGVYEQPTFRIPQYGQPRQESSSAAGRRPEYQAAGPQPYGWNTPGAVPYGAPPAGGFSVPGQDIRPTSPYASPGAVGIPAQSLQQQLGGPPYAGLPGQQTPAPVQQQQPPQQGPVGYGVVPQGGYAGHQPGVPYSQQGPTPYPVHGQQQVPQQQQLAQPQQPLQEQHPVQQQQLLQPQQSQSIPQQQPLQQPIQAQPLQSHIQPVLQNQPLPQQSVQQQAIHVQPQAHTQVYGGVSSPQDQPQTQAQTQAQQPQTQVQQPQAQAQEPKPQAQPELQVQSQVQAQPLVDPQQPISGQPPYVYNPSYTYADPNVQAWAQYYAQGGKDTAGAVYFFSIPGVTDAQEPAAPATQNLAGQQPVQQHPVQQQNIATQPTTHAHSGEAANIAVGSMAQQQPQPQTNPNSFQLRDQPAYAVPGAQYQQQSIAHAQGPAADTLSSSSPQQTSPALTGPIRQNSGGSPTQTLTPAWVLPKKIGPPARDTPAAPVADASYFPPTAQGI